ncbi:LIP-domain-containing protein [Thozetella sp. PMI_491]|nr:LIP-domain-containing protein [Thozetella sp. PMI_491]
MVRLRTPLLLSLAAAGSGLQLPVPSQDEWYLNPPHGWNSTAPGTVLRIRRHPYDSPPKPIKTAVDIVQVQFSTTDSHDKPSYAVTSILIPTSHAACLNDSSSTGNCSRGLLAYLMPYDTSCLDASPSYSLQFGDPFGDVTAALERGWFVSVPDYEGPQASFGANYLGGHIILDSIRAALTAAGQFGFQNETGKTAIWGYSSGGAASEFTIELAESYAPDLRDKIVGAVVGGATANSTLSISILNAQPGAGILVQGIIGVMTQYPDAWGRINSSLRQDGPYNIDGFYRARTLYGFDTLVQYANQDVYDYFTNGSVALNAPEMEEIRIREGWIGRRGTPRMPVFFYHAIQDTLCPIEGVDAAVAKYCADGANILYHRNTLGDHNDELFKGQERALQYLDWVLDGNGTAGIRTPTKGCQWLNVTVGIPE